MIRREFAPRGGDGHQWGGAYGPGPAKKALTSEEEVRLAEAIAVGEDEPRARLIEANFGLVVRIAREFRGRGLPMDDLVGEGNLGLIKAAERFDAAFGVRFCTYAAHWIRQSIREALMDAVPTIRLPAYMYKLVAEWRRAEKDLARETGREPGFDEVADRLGLEGPRRGMAAKALQAGRTRLEVDAFGGSGMGLGGTLDDSEGPEPAIESREEWDVVARGLTALDARQRFILAHRFGLGGADELSVKEISGRLGCTREWVRRLERRAFQQLFESTQHA